MSPSYSLKCWWRITADRTRRASCRANKQGAPQATELRSPASNTIYCDARASSHCGLQAEIEPSPWLRLTVSPKTPTLSDGGSNALRAVHRTSLIGRTVVTMPRLTRVDTLALSLKLQDYSLKEVIQAQLPGYLATACYDYPNSSHMNSYVVSALSTFLAVSYRTLTSR